MHSSHGGENLDIEIKMLLDEMQRRNIKSLLDINEAFRDVFQGEYSGFDKAELVEQLENLKLSTKRFDGCSLVKVFWSQPSSKLEMISNILAQKVKYVFIWENQSPNWYDWHAKLQRAKFDTEFTKKTDAGAIEVWVNKLWLEQERLEQIKAPKIEEPKKIEESIPDSWVQISSALEKPILSSEGSPPSAEDGTARDITMPEASDYKPEAKKRARHPRKKKEAAQ